MELVSDDGVLRSEDLTCKVSSCLQENWLLGFLLMEEKDGGRISLPPAP